MIRVSWFPRELRRPWGTPLQGRKDPFAVLPFACVPLSLLNSLLQMRNPPSSHPFLEMLEGFPGPQNCPLSCKRQREIYLFPSPPLAIVFQVYPTATRALGLGTCSGMARVGALITPFIAQVSVTPNTEGVGWQDARPNKSCQCAWPSVKASVCTHFCHPDHSSCEQRKIVCR